jgi:pilus assembly protein CpaF
MGKKIDFITLTGMVQEYISANYAAALTDQTKLPQLRSYIEKYLRDQDYTVDDRSLRQLTDDLYSEMAEYSILTPYLGSPLLEEININSWDDIALTYLDGSIVKLKENFFSAQHSVDIVKRLLHHSGMVIDNATPIAQGHLPHNTRIAAIKEPVIDAERGISASIRLLHPQNLNREQLVETQFATQKMMDFLSMCIRYGVSFVISGATSSGKTTLLNALLMGVPDNKRIFSIESGSRELSFIRKMDERITNNVVNTLSRPSDNPAYDISQEDLVVTALRFNPNILVIGEMRNEECYSAVEASLTGHTVVSTVHSSASDYAHQRIALLCQKRFPIDFSISLIQSAQAFPVVVYTHQLDNNDRKIMNISECEILASGERRYRTLFGYQIVENTVKGEHFEIEGFFDQPCIMSDSLKKRLTEHGAPQSLLKTFLEKEDV